MPIPIVGGARLSGTTGAYDVGFLAMKTEALGLVPSNNFVVGRLRKNFLSGSSVGAIVTSRDSTRSGDHNQLYGVDTLLRFFERKLDVSAYLLGTETPGLEGSSQARLLDAAWRDDDFTIVGRYETVQPDFNPEVGFVRRDDMTHYLRRRIVAAAAAQPDTHQKLRIRSRRRSFPGSDRPYRNRRANPVGRHRVSGQLRSRRSPSRTRSIA